PVRAPRQFHRLRATLRLILTPFAPLSAAFHWLLTWTFRRLNRHVQWHQIPRWLLGVRTGLVLANFWVLRNVLRAETLHDTSMLPMSGLAPLPAAGPDVIRWRTADGSFNDLRDPWMGRAVTRSTVTGCTAVAIGARFGRNVPLGYTYPDTVRL